MGSLGKCWRRHGGCKEVLGEVSGRCQLGEGCGEVGGECGKDMSGDCGDVEKCWVSVGMWEEMEGVGRGVVEGV